MSRETRGQKHVCHGCHTRFYDLKKDPIICPKCGAIFDADTMLRNRRLKQGKSTVLHDLPEDTVPQTPILDEIDLAIVVEDEVLEAETLEDVIDSVHESDEE